MKCFQRFSKTKSAKQNIVKKIIFLYFDFKIKK